MSRGTVIGYLVVLSFVDAVIPLPILGGLLIYGIMARPRWFTDLARDVLGAA
jgi:hypothetical protein